MIKANFFHVGPPKSATTWLYHVLRSHADIGSPPKDSIHYFNMNYWRGDEWYHAHFSNPDRRVYFDPSPSYGSSVDAIKRIAKYNPDARLAFTIRNPIERAFSHYWHEKKKRKISFKFEEVTENHDLFTNWVLPGLYYRSYSMYQEYIKPENIHIMVFDDFDSAPKKSITSLLNFLNIEPEFDEKILAQKRNVATATWKAPFRTTVEEKLAQVRGGKRITRFVDRVFPQEREYLSSVDREVVSNLMRIFEPDIRSMERMLERSFDTWRMI